MRARDFRARRHPGDAGPDSPLSGVVATLAPKPERPETQGVDPFLLFPRLTDNQGVGGPVEGERPRENLRASKDDNSHFTYVKFINGTENNRVGKGLKAWIKFWKYFEVHLTSKREVVRLHSDFTKT